MARASAAAMGTTVRIEGYPPPWDPRLEVIKVTPDPGVIDAWTERVKEALKAIGVPLVDHIIVAGGSTISFAERGLI